MAKECIEREVAIKAALDGADEWDGGCNKERDKKIKQYLDAIPAADVAPVVHGRWEREEDTYFGFTDVEHRCSQCGKAYSRQGFCAFHFCPNCGADMREAEI